MPNDAPSPARAAQANAQLQRVAAALEVPVEHFFGQPSSKSDTADMAELLRLWHGIADTDDRRALLAIARDLVGRSARQRVAAE